jgi:hypothetical protein
LGGGDEGLEEGSAGGADVVGAFGVPLDAEEEALGGMFHVEHFGFHGFWLLHGFWLWRGFVWFHGFLLLDGFVLFCGFVLFHGFVLLRGFWLFHGWDEFDGFDDFVVGAAGYDAETFAGEGYGLVVAGVDGEAEG